MRNKTKRITVSALLVALGVLFSRLVSIPVSLGGAYSFNLGLGMLPILLICVLYGPIYGCFGALIWDLLGAIIFPKGAFVIWFTLAAGVLGLVTGAFFSKIETTHVDSPDYGYGTVWTVYHAARPATIKRIFIAVLCGQFIYSVFLNTLLITLLYSVPVKVLIIPRLIENIIMVFINTALINLLLRALRHTGIVEDRISSPLLLKNQNKKATPISEPDADNSEKTVEMPDEQNSIDAQLCKLESYIDSGDAENAKEELQSLLDLFMNNRAMFNKTQLKRLRECKNKQKRLSQK